MDTSEPVVEQGFTPETQSLDLFTLFVGITAFLGYVILGIVSVLVIAKLRSWAYRGQIKPLTDKEIIDRFIYWPFVLPYCSVVYLYKGITNRTSL
jgi:hypothetical protein